MSLPMPRMATPPLPVAAPALAAVSVASVVQRVAEPA